MTLLLVGFLAILVSASGTSYANVEDEHEYIFFPDGDGILHLVDLKDDSDETMVQIMGQNDEDDVTFYLYTQENPQDPEVLIPYDVEALGRSFWDNSRPTRFITHGWKGHAESLACTAIRDAYLSIADYNVVVVDWGKISSLLYLGASKRVPLVAERVAEMIDYLNYEGGLNLKTTGVIGHSLGAHVMGIAAHKANDTVANVVGLDPAKPLFSNGEAGNRIHKTDGDNVQIIHTDPGRLGLPEAIGHSDFYPNEGKTQPGCGIDLFGSCSHGRSYLYLAESIQNPTGFPSSPMEFTHPKSSFFRTPIFMGGPTLNIRARGRYTVKTASSPPFALG